eukprot:1092916-Prymnesium_polylepis.1
MRRRVLDGRHVCGAKRRSHDARHMPRSCSNVQQPLIPGGAHALRVQKLAKLGSGDDKERSAMQKCRGVGAAPAQAPLQGKFEPTLYKQACEACPTAYPAVCEETIGVCVTPVSYTHLRAHETLMNL